MRVLASEAFDAAIAPWSVGYVINVVVVALRIGRHVRRWYECSRLHLLRLVLEDDFFACNLLTILDSNNLLSLLDQLMITTLDW